MITPNIKLQGGKSGIEANLPGVSEFQRLAILPIVAAGIFVFVHLLSNPDHLQLAELGLF